MARKRFIKILMGEASASPERGKLYCRYCKNL